MKAQLKNAVGTFSLLLLITCTAFVAFQSYKCLRKFINPPEVTEISFQSNGNLPFPSMTFCPNHFNMKVENKFPKPYSSEFLESCNLSYDEYIAPIPKWSTTKCKDASKLYKDATSTSTLPFFNISWVEVTTRESGLFNLKVNDENLKWTTQARMESGLCQTLKISETLTRQGIVEVQVKMKKTKGERFFLDLHLHQDDLLFTDLENANAFTRLTDPKTTLSVTYEDISYLNFDGEKCESDPYYRLDQCRVKALNEQCIHKYGCTVPFQLIESRICTAIGPMQKSRKLFEETIGRKMKIKKCPLPCQFLNIKIAGKDVGGTDKLGHEKVIMKFDTYVKSIKTKTSYSALELMAEVGGYVGLFLGVSVYHLKDLLNKIIDSQCKF